MPWLLLIPFLTTVFSSAQASLFNHEQALGMACALAARELFTDCKEEEYDCYCDNSLYVYTVQNCIGRESHYNSTTMGKSYDKFSTLFCEAHGSKVNVTNIWSTENKAQNPEVNEKSFTLAYNGERNNMSQKSVSAWLGIGMILYWVMIVAVVTATEWIRMFILRLVQYRVVMRRPLLLERWLQKHVFLPALFGTRHMRRFEYLRGWVVFTTPTRFESLVVSGYILIALIFMLTPYTFMDNDPLFPTRWKEMMRYSSDRAGIIATVQLPLLILFALRNNIFIWITGWSYSTFNTYHRAVARITYLLLIIHAILKHIFSASYGGSLVKYYYPVPYFRWGCAAIGLFTLMVASAVFRARGYEIFYRLHQVLAIGALVCSHYHLNGLGFKIPLWISFSFWGADWLIRFLRILLFNINFILPPLPGARSTTFATMRLYNGQLLRVSIVTPVRWKCYAGQYVYLHTSQLSFIGGHPFSVLGSNEYGEGLELVIKARDGMTRKLCARLSERGCSPEYPITLPVYVEGPYGVSAPVERYEEGMFFAGGIGITGILGYMEKMIAANIPGTIPKRVKLFWAIRARSDVEPVMHVLSRLVNIEGVEINIFLHQHQVQPALSGAQDTDEKDKLELETIKEDQTSTTDTSDLERASDPSTPNHGANAELDAHNRGTMASHRASISTRMSLMQQRFSFRPNSSLPTDPENKNQQESDNVPRNSYINRKSLLTSHSARKSLVPHMRPKSEINQFRHSLVNFVKARNPEEENDDGFDYGRGNFEANFREEEEVPMVSTSGPVKPHVFTNDAETREDTMARHEKAQFVNAGFTDSLTRRMTIMSPFDDKAYPIRESSTPLPASQTNTEAETLIISQIQPIRMDIVSIVRNHFLRADGSVCVVGCGPDRMVDTLAWASRQFLDLAEYGRVDYIEEAFRW